MFSNVVSGSSTSATHRLRKSILHPQKEEASTSLLHTSAERSGDNQARPGSVVPFATSTSGGCESEKKRPQRDQHHQRRRRAALPRASPRELLNFLYRTWELEDPPPAPFHHFITVQQIAANDAVDRDRKADHRKFHQTQPFHLTVCITGASVPVLMTVPNFQCPQD